MNTIENEATRYLLLAESKGNKHCQAIFYECQNKLEAAEMELSNVLKEGTDSSVRYCLTRIEVLKEILKLPDEGKEYLERMEEQS